MPGEQRIDWSTLWKKDDWLSVWVGFFILVVFIAGFTIKLPVWKWMTDGEFNRRIAGWTSEAEILGKNGEAKGEEIFQREMGLLKMALDSKDRKAIGDTAGKFENAIKDVGDKDLKKSGDKLAGDMKTASGQTIGKFCHGGTSKVLFMSS